MQRLLMLSMLLLGICVACGNQKDNSQGGIESVADKVTPTSEATMVLEDTATNSLVPDSFHIQSDIETDSQLLFNLDSTLYAVRFDGAEATRIDDALEIKSISPNHQAIAYFKPATQTLYVYNQPANKIYPAVTLEDEANLRTEAWSPNGEWLIVNKTVPTNPEFSEMVGLTNGTVEQVLVGIDGELNILPSLPMPEDTPPEYPIYLDYTRVLAWTSDNRLLILTENWWDATSHFTGEILEPTTGELTRMSEDKEKLIPTIFYDMGPSGSNGQSDYTRRFVERNFNFELAPIPIPFDGILPAELRADAPDQTFTLQANIENLNSATCKSIQFIIKPLNATFLPFDFYNTKAAYISDLFIDSDGQKVTFLRTFSPTCDTHQLRHQVVQVDLNEPHAETVVFQTPIIGTDAIWPVTAVSAEGDFIVWSSRSEASQQTTLYLTTIVSGATQALMVFSSPSEADGVPSNMISNLVWVP